MSMSISVYGSTGIIGSYFVGLHGGRPLLRDQLAPMDKEALYLISTTSNTYSDPLIHTDTNIDCLMKRLVACQRTGLQTFNFISSWFVYGPTTDIMAEHSQCSPKGLYSITKYCAEQLVIDFCSFHGIDWRIMRLPNLYGGRDKSDGQRNILHYIVQQLKASKAVEVVSGLTRDYLHIYDVCQAINFLISSSPVNDVYNIGSGQETLLSDCIDFCAKTLNSQSTISFRPHRNHEQSLRMRLDCRKLQALGFAPSIPLYQGLQDLCTTQKFSTPAHFSMETKFKQP